MDDNNWKLFYQNGVGTKTLQKTWLIFPYVTFQTQPQPLKTDLGNILKIGLYTNKFQQSYVSTVFYLLIFSIMFYNNFPVQKFTHIFFIC